MSLHVKLEQRKRAVGCIADGTLVLIAPSRTFRIGVQLHFMLDQLAQLVKCLVTEFANVNGRTMQTAVGA